MFIIKITNKTEVETYILLQYVRILHNLLYVLHNKIPTFKISLIAEGTIKIMYIIPKATILDKMNISLIFLLGQTSTSN